MSISLQEAPNLKELARRIKQTQVAAFKALRQNENEAVAQILGLLKKLDKELRLQIALIDPEQFKAIHLGRIQSLVSDLLNDFEHRADTIIRSHTIGGLKSSQITWNATNDILGALPSASIIVPVLPDTILSVSANMSTALIRGLADEIRKQVVTTLQRAVIGSQTPFETARQLSTIIGPRGGVGASAAADRIVRTEINRAYNTADELFRQQAIERRPEDLPILKKFWITMNDDRVRDSHEAMHKVVVNADDDFTVPIIRIVKGTPVRVGSEQMQAPGDPLASAGNTINCRCKTITVPEDFLDEMLAQFPG